MQENRIKKVVRDGGVAVGIYLTEFATRGIAKLLESVNLDWVMVGVSYGSFSIDTVANLIAWFKATPISVIVVSPNHLLPEVMEAGATGVQVENVESAADARAIVDTVMYPPLGHRPIGIHVGHTDFKRPQVAEYIRARNAQVSIVATIESLRGLDNVDEIAAVEGIDILQPSHHDLSVALGVPQQYDHPTYKEAVRKIADACMQHGKMLKAHPISADEITDLYQLGCRIMAINNAVLVFQKGMEAEVTGLHGHIAQLSKK